MWYVIARPTASSSLSASFAAKSSSTRMKKLWCFSGLFHSHRILSLCLKLTYSPSSANTLVIQKVCLQELGSTLTRELQNFWLVELLSLLNCINWRIIGWLYAMFIKPNYLSVVKIEGKLVGSKAMFFHKRKQNQQLNNELGDLPLLLEHLQPSTSAVTKRLSHQHFRWCVEERR